jgi:hypothetical protein
MYLYRTVRHHSLEDRNNDKHSILKMEAVGFSRTLLATNLHGVTSQKTMVLTFTVMRTSGRFYVPLAPNLCSVLVRYPACWFSYPWNSFEVSDLKLSQWFIVDVDLLLCTVLMWAVVPTFRWCLLPGSSGSKYVSKKWKSFQVQLRLPLASPCSLLSLLSDPEDGSDMFLRNSRRYNLEDGILQLVSFSSTQSIGLLGRGISPSQGHYLRIG